MSVRDDSKLAYLFCVNAESDSEDYEETTSRVVRDTRSTQTLYTNHKDLQEEIDRRCHAVADMLQPYFPSVHRFKLMRQVLTYVPAIVKMQYQHATDRLTSTNHL